MINKEEYKKLLNNRQFDKLELKLDKDIGGLLNNILEGNIEDLNSETGWYNKLEIVRNKEPKIIPILDVYEETIINDEYSQLDRINNYIQTYGDIQNYIEYKDIL